MRGACFFSIVTTSALLLAGCGGESQTTFTGGTGGLGGAFGGTGGASGGTGGSGENPACTITAPSISPAHPELNGVPAPAGDRVSAEGSPYQVRVEVGTTAEDGQRVVLTVDGNPQALATNVDDGKAVFDGVELTPDGEHTLSAECEFESTTVASGEVTYTVDTEAPDLSAEGLEDGSYFGPTGDSDPSKDGLQIDICGSTDSADALSLSSELGDRAANFCVAIGTATPECVSAKPDGVIPGLDGGCVELTCPGGAPFDLTLALVDDAGNRTTEIIKGVTCASSLPSVQIIDPTTFVPGDSSTNILAANAEQERKDQSLDAGDGAQYTVTACTDTAGGTGRLLGGLVGEQQDELATAEVVPAEADDDCPAGLGNILRFEGATLPESREDTDGNLAVATALTVEVTAPSSAVGSSPSVQVWVDSAAPTVSTWVPIDLCGKMYQAKAAKQVDLELTSTSPNLELVLDGPSGQVTPPYDPETDFNSGRAFFDSLTFELGTTDVIAVATEPSGNMGALESPCVVQVGNPPIVTWLTPTQQTQLNASSDADSALPGWQGTLSVQVDEWESGDTVTFTADGSELGTAAIDASGVATLELTGSTSPSGIEDDSSVRLRATTSEITDRGVGVATLGARVVDTIVPDAVSDLTAEVFVRRATSFKLDWTAPADGTESVNGYQVRVSTSPIDSSNFSSANAIIYSGNPAAPGAADSIVIPDRFIEQDYYFAIAAQDAGGNVSQPRTVGPMRASFNTRLITRSSGPDDRYRVVDGSASVDGDAFSDLLVGTFNGNDVWLFFGSQNGIGENPDVTFSGNANTRFGNMARFIGDIDSDGMEDIAIAATLGGGPGRVYIYKGRDRESWTPAMPLSAADYVIEPNPSAEPKFAGANFGFDMTPLGDFDGDGADDFAIGAHRYGMDQGFVAVVYGVLAGTPFPARVILPSDYGTRVLGIEGEQAASGSQFGLALTGLGNLYANHTTTLVVGAPGASKVYAFSGLKGVKIDATRANDVFVGPAGSRSGQSLTHAGQFSGNPLLGVGAPAYGQTSGGKALMFFGNAIDGPFEGNTAILTNSEATGTLDGFGIGLVGPGIPGNTVDGSFIGSAAPDIVVSSLKESGESPTLYFVRGEKMISSGDVVNKADVKYPMPSDWRGVGAYSSVIDDIDDDGFADLAVAEFQLSGNYSGRVLVLW